MEWEAVIGLEVHVELATKSKMFCRCEADHFGKEPNTQVCPVCLGLPGALPVPNREAIEKTIKLGLALGCEVASFSKFDRKNYFYPDLPKGYQISQYDLPLAVNGKWTIANGKRIGIRRVHQEEDTGKLIHSVVDGEKVSMIDYNRSGVPLTEIVTEPDFETVEEVMEFLKKLAHLVRWIGVSEADMEKGSMRLEANVSIRKTQNAKRKTAAQSAKPKDLPDYKVELKNINSFRFLRQAIEYEMGRQRKVLEEGGRVVQETRGYDAVGRVTFSQRGKEGEADYRYFPEPDIPPLTFSQGEIEEWRKSLPELPGEVEERWRKSYGLPENYLKFLLESRERKVYFNEAVKVGKKYGILAEKIAVMLVNKKVDMEKILPAKLIEWLREEKEGVMVSDRSLAEVVVQSIKVNEKAVNDYRAGKEMALQFLIGQVMAKIKGKAEAGKVRDLLLTELGKKN